MQKLSNPVPDEPTLEVILAKPRGFCAGVVRAIEIVERALEQNDGDPVYVRHEIVHNRHVVNSLRDKGAVFVDELSEVPPGALTVFSAHGVAKSVQAEARERGLPVLDATCPLVTKVHSQGRRYAKAGRAVILIGHEGHVEVIGTVGQIDAPVHIVSTAEGVAALPIAEDAPVAYVTQTTLSVDDTRDVIAAIHQRFTDVVGPDVADICYATQNRQTAVRDLCRVSDMLIVVGAKNSSNSSRLREIGTELGIPSYQIDDGDGVEQSWFEGVARVGLTAGASAPDLLVQSVIDAVARFRTVRVSQLDGIDEHVAFSLPGKLRGPIAPTAAAAE
ncbi:4-hydroxy-3-methylbut-2-enyl diphosphate reductase [Sphingomonas tabacisoli]|uniref:4-hydroxy-3-methylbut-2-enyl diphosphate reductase n=1 Tax=Sphingomonas tabacisoli TaxID=2249466 RepID=A0ABW4I505_9SPHN